MPLNRPRSHPLMMIAMIGVALVGILVGLALWQNFQSMRQQSQHIQQESSQLAKLQRMTDKADRLLLQSQKNQSPNTHLAGSFSTTAASLMARIETSWSTDVSFLRMDADMRSGRMRIELLAKSDDALFMFVTRLKQQLGEKVFLERQAITKVALWPLQATLVLEW